MCTSVMLFRFFSNYTRILSQILTIKAQNDMKLESLFILWFSLKQIAAWMEVFGAEDQILKDDTTTVFQVYSSV